MPAAPVRRCDVSHVTVAAGRSTRQHDRVPAHTGRANQFSIREGTPADADAIVRVVNAGFAVERAFVNTNRTYRDEILERFGEGRFLVAETGRGELAAAIFLRLEGDEGYFGLLAVDPVVQGAGLGRQMVAAAENEFRKLGCSRVRIVVPNLRDDLFPWYASQGYEERAVLPFPEPEKLTREAHMVELVKELMPAEAPSQA